MNLNAATTPLGEVTLKIGSGATPRGGKEFYKTEGVSLFRSLNVYDLLFDSSGLAFIDDDQAAQLANVEVLSGDVLLNITGASVARCALAPSHLLPARVNQHVAILRPDPRVLSGRYLNYVLVSPRHKGRLLAIAQGGATREALTKATLEQFDVPVPSLPIQRKIAAVLAAYDDLIENNLRRIGILEQMAQAVYREWFINFRFPGHDDVALVDSSLGPIPDGWKLMMMSDFTKTQYGYTASANSEPVGPKFLRGMDFNKRPWIDWTEVPYCPIEDADFKKYRVEIGDVLVIRMADPGKVAIVEKDLEAVFASYVVRIAPDREQALPYWLYYYMASPAYQGYISGAGTGTTRKSASAGVLTGSRLALPPKTLQASFVDVVGPLRRLLDNLIDQNANLRSTRDLLLPKLVSGEIDVSEMDIATEWLAS